MPPVPRDVAFGTLTEQVTAQGITIFAALPTTGTAQYQGLVRLNLPLGTNAASPYHGALAVNVAFGDATDRMTGTISNLQGAGGTLTGDLQISGGTFYPSAAPARDYQFSANLAGVLVQGVQNHTLTGQLSGDFFGTTGQGMAGVIYQGMIRQGEVIDTFDGAFVAERSGR